MRNTRYLFLLLFFIHARHGHSQNILASPDHAHRHIADRLYIQSGGALYQLHPSIYPYYRHDLVMLADSAGMKISPDKIDQYDLQHIRDQNNEFVTTLDGDTRRYTDSTKTFYYLEDTLQSSRYRLSKRPIFKTFYKTPAHFYQTDVKDFYLRVNPLINFGIGRETQEGVTTFYNQRGLSIRGGIGKGLYFQTSVFDSQVRYANYINSFTAEYGVVPGAGFYKPFESAFFKLEDGRDFLLANAYVGFNVGKYVGLQLGHHQHFIGDGIRSLFLSDFSTPFFSLKVNTRIWKLHYQNIFAELAADEFQNALSTGKPIPKKYMAAHYLSFKANRHLTLGLFETVIFNRDNHQFELQYLNPVILYRTVEGSVGSPDNVMLGLNARWDFKQSVSLYGQFMLDDILVKEILNGNLGWWGNKFGHQLGVKYINAAGIDHLDLQLEWNSVRPYTYSHYNFNANYSHFKQALAHPAGANFTELVGRARYRVSPKLSLESTLMLLKKGEDIIDSISLGGDIIKSNNLRPSDQGHTLGQGVPTNIVLWTSSVHFEISHGLFIDARYLYRKKTSDLPERNQTTGLFEAGIRLNMAWREEVF